MSDHGRNARCRSGIVSIIPAANWPASFDMSRVSGSQKAFTPSRHTLRLWCAPLCESALPMWSDGMNVGTRPYSSASERRYPFVRSASSAAFSGLSCAHVN